MTLAIVVVSFNARADLERCLASLAAAPPRAGHEIIVVDNASTDGAPDMVAQRFPAVRLIRAPGNVGFARANNLGMRATSAEFVLLLNPDTEVPPGALDGLLAEFERVSGTAVLGPRIVDGAGVPELSFGAAPTPLTEFWQRTLGRLHERGVAPARVWVNRITRRPRDTTWVSGACLLVRRADAEAVGLMEERYFLYWEDVDFCMRLRSRGRVRFTPAVTITHLRGRSQQGLNGPVQAAYRRGQVLYYSTHRPRWAPFVRRYLSMRGLAPPDDEGRVPPASRVE